MEFVKLYAIIAAVTFIVIAPLIIFYYRSGRGFATLKFSFTGPAIKKAANGGTRKHARILIPILRTATLAMLLVAFARPRSGDEVAEIHKKGVAIQMLMDRSGSMQEGFSSGKFGGKMTRFDAVKKVFTDFVVGGDGFTGRASDMIGLTTFARFVEENCPLTLDHDNLIGFVDNTEIATGAEDGTAIGDAIYHASLSLIAVEDLLADAAKAGNDYKIKSRVIILLTDGKQNTGNYTPEEAAQFARDNGIKIYTIAVGGKNSFRNVNDLFGGAFQLFTGEHIDTRPLENVAEITGGEFAKAENFEELKRIYERIDSLEKTEFEHKFVRWKEHFQTFLGIGLALLLLEQVLSATWLRRLP